MLPKFRRLSRRDLNLCINTGKTLRFPNFYLKYLSNNLTYSRFGVVTSTKLAKSAVVRNKLRREIYAQCSVLSAQGSDNFDIIFFPQKSMLNLEHEEIGIVVNKALSEI
ncbi:MAG: ribonuclease P protein component, partial [Candidatus Amesbacteria bacterium]|nr:ribonuclease P protein component [Candidatus Amesbacteria bacterium]